MSNRILLRFASACTAGLALTACPSDDSSTSTTNQVAETSTGGDSDSSPITVSDSTPTTTNPDTTTGPGTADSTDTGTPTTDTPTTDATETGATETGATETDATGTGATDTDATGTGATGTGATDTDATGTGATDTDATTTAGPTCPEIDGGNTVPAIIAIDTTGAGDDSQGSCNRPTGGPDVTVSFTAPAAGDYYFTTLREATDTDTVLYVLDGCDGTELPMGDGLACNDDVAQGNLSSFVQVTLTDGQTVVAVVDGYDAEAVGVSELYIQQIPDPVDGGPCCVDNSGASGCDAGPIEACVCGFDSLCCDTEWDDICVAAAQEVCNLTCT